MTDVVSNQSTLSYCLWIMVIEISHFNLSVAEENAKMKHRMLFTSEELQRIKEWSIIGINCVTDPFLTFTKQEQDVVSCAPS